MDELTYNPHEELLSANRRHDEHARQALALVEASNLLSLILDALITRETGENGQKPQNVTINTSEISGAVDAHSSDLAISRIKNSIDAVDGASKHQQGLSDAAVSTRNAILNQIRQTQATPINN